MLFFPRRGWSRSFRIAADLSSPGWPVFLEPDAIIGMFIASPL